MQKLELELTMLLPAAPDERDGCTARLCALLEGIRGVTEVHVERKNGTSLVCLHYDPDLATLAALERAAQSAGVKVSTRYTHDLVPIEGMDCSDCVVVIEHALRRLDGVLAVTVNYASQIVRVEYDTTRVARSAVVATLERLGYRVPKKGAAAFVDKYRELLFTLGCGVLIVAAWIAERFVGAGFTFTGPLFLAAYALGGWDIARHAWQALREGHVDTDLLMIAAALGAAAVGALADGARLLFLFGLGHALEELALDRARQAVRKLGELTPRFESPARAHVPEWRAATAAPPAAEYRLNARAGGPFGIQWTINGEAFVHDEGHGGAVHASMNTLRAGEWSKLRFTDESYRLHPMHLHGQFFKVLSRNGRPVDEPYWRDTVLVHAQESVDVGMVPLDEGRWMLRCHILEHAESGMMTTVEVRPQS